jgi:hypothetical protein
MKLEKLRKTIWNRINRFAYLFISMLLAQSLITQAQITPEHEILTLSDQIFRWEVEENIDEIEKVFHDKFVVVGGDGEIQTKEQYIALLRRRKFIHDSVVVEENKVTVSGNTATVIGKAKFEVTASGEKIVLRLSFIEVFTRSKVNKPWKVLAMHATALQD